MSKKKFIISFNIFFQDIIKEVLKSKFLKSKNKITEDTIELMAEIAKILVIEGSLRAAKQASLESRTTITLEHVETILPQLVCFLSVSL